ncbi:hydrolase [Mycobacterium bohemicum DSM 44277]|uniref:Hydrolase n=1 Tax=Mycobacterium bohemicum DSM 44277 TaxID=1236609 RepID=A0A0U0WBN6_MYCBE|nr:hydrolase [Mycobacterium bohemicum DSM 44277]
MAARLARIDAIEQDRDRITAELSEPPLAGATEESLRRIEDAASTVDRIGDQLALTSAAVELTAATDIELDAGGRRISLAAGQSWSTTATGPTVIEVPGVLTATVTPGATTLDVRAR